MIDNLAYTQHPPALVKEGFLYHFKDWQGFPLFVFFSARPLDFRREKNKNRLCKILGIKRENLIMPEQQHSGFVELIDNKNFREKIFCDGLITKERKICLAVLTADCLPIFLYDPAIPAIGIVHAGWRSTKEGILGNSVVCMQKEFATEPHNLKVAIGPGIRDCCYQVREDLFSYFPGQIRERNGQFFLDLVEANLKQLISLGVNKGNIIDSGICSCCHNDDFFSYRREGDSAGRTISAIMLNEDITYGAKRPPQNIGGSAKALWRKRKL